jgi:hypothetical protein
MHRVAAWSLAITLCLTAGGAWAQPTIAVLGVEAPDGPAELAVRLTTGLRTVVKNAAGYRLVPSKDLDEIKLVFGCVDEKPDCMARAGSGMQVAKLVWGTLEKTAGGYSLTLRLLDVATARIEKVAPDTVSAAKMAGAGARTVVERLAAGLLGGPRGTIKVTCNVAGADVLVGQKVVGQAESSGLLIRDLAVGTVTVTVRKEGYRTWTQPVAVQASETTLVDVTLEEAEGKVEPPPPATQPIVTPAAPPSKTGWKVVFWTSAALTVGLAVGAIATGAQVLNGRGDLENAANKYYKAEVEATHWVVGTNVDLCSDPRNKDADGIRSVCDDNQSKALITNILWGVAGAMAVVSGVLYWKAYVAKDAPAAETKPKPAEARKIQWNVTSAVGATGGSVGLNLRF